MHAIRFAVLVVLMLSSLLAQELFLKGRIVDSQGNTLPNVSVQLLVHNRVISEVRSDPSGQFLLTVRTPGDFTIKTKAPGFLSAIQQVTVRPTANPEITITVGQVAYRHEYVTVTADANEFDVLLPDPSEKVFVTRDLLDANPGRPGAPVSIPGYPVETASGGIKAPQYFAPGVAGDHGEPIAQYILVGSYFLPNNLSANAHGNGYADPNIFVPEVLESVQVDGGAFDVREGNHSVNLAATYGLRPRIERFFAISGDYRDIDVVAGFSPSADSLVAFSSSYGNGFLNRLEHRQQYKFNGQRLFKLRRHRIIVFVIGYYGSSKIPGLVPIFPTNSKDARFANLEDSIDPRQKEQTHTALIALNDVWQVTPSQQLQLSSFFRTYDLALYSDFGPGLIRQSEFRTVAGGGANYVKGIGEYLSLLGGFDCQREAPRRDNLDHYGFVDPKNQDYYGPFTPVASNNLNISPLTFYIAAEGTIRSRLRYYLGWRRDEIHFQNEDLLRPDNSFRKWVGLNSPKSTVSFLPKESWFVPLISLSFGQAFFTNDPRTGIGSAPPTAVNTSIRTNS